MALGISPTQIVENGEYQLLGKARHWVRVPLSYVAEVQNGFAFKSTFFDREQGLPLIRIRDITRTETEHRYQGEYEERYLVRPGDVLIGMDGDFTVARWKGPPGLLNQRVCRLKLITDRINERFFFLCLQPYLDAINAETSSVTVKHLSSKSVEAIPLPLPPRGEQDRIVAKIEELFSELDNGVENLQRAREQLQVCRQALLKHAFEGKLTARWREENSADSSSFEPRSATPEAQELDRLPQLPQGWSYKHLGTLIERPRYGTSKKCTYEFEGRGVLRIPNIANGVVDPSDLKGADFDPDEASKYSLKRGDVLVIRSNGSVSLVGKCALVAEADERFLFAGYLIRLRSDPTVLLPEYLALAMSSRTLRSQIEAAAKSTSGVHNINSKEIQALTLPLCSLEEQRHIVSRLDRDLSILDALSCSLEGELKKAESLRQSILRRAFAGELVPQDPADEPASVLLERIRAESSNNKKRKTGT